MKLFLAIALIVLPNTIFADNLSNRSFKPLAKTEKRQVIAILDTGIIINRFTSKYLCDGGHLDVTGYGLKDVHGHGTHIAGIFAQRMDPSKQCLIIIKWYHNKKTPETAMIPVATEIKALQAANKLKPILVNLSLSGDSYSKDEALEIKNLLKNGVKVVVSAGNDHKNLGKECDIFPACNFNEKRQVNLTKNESKNYFVIASGTKQSIAEYSNHGGPVTSVENGSDVISWSISADLIGMELAYMSGTSQAAAVFSATESQLLLGLGGK